MTIKTIKLSTIISPENNPRKSFNDATIEGLADSIKNDGLLQNLVVAPSKGKKYRIISGERRYRAMQLLLEKGDITDDFEVSVEVRANLSKHDQLRIATVENVQREKLPPIDEAEAFTSLVQKGVSLSDIAAQTGMSKATIKKRLALAELCDEVKQALCDNVISLSVAEALTLGNHDAQRTMLNQKDKLHFNADFIRENLIDQKPSVSLSIFPIEQYQGTFTSDLFAEEDSTYFDDEEQFLTLQKEAVAKKQQEYLSEGAEFVDITEDYSITTWQYRDAEEGENTGVAINLSPCGEVEILENIVKHNIDSEAVEVVVAQQKPKVFYSSPLCRNMALHKSMAVQAELLKNPKLCMIISILMMMDDRKVHDCLNEFCQTDIKPKGYAIINEAAKEFIELLPSIEKRKSDEWNSLKYSYYDEGNMFNELLALEDAKLEQLHSLLVAMKFGQEDCNNLDTHENSVFNLVAQKMDVDMIHYWRPDSEFLKRRNKEQLLDIAKDSGLNTKLGMIQNYKKTELVNALEEKFSQVSQQESFSEVDVKIDTWLPEAMQFPAVDITVQETMEAA